MALKGAQLYGKHVVAPVAKYTVRQALKQPGIANAPEVQAAQSMFRDAKAAYQSPQGQALMSQFLQAAKSPQAQALMTQAKQVATSPQAQAAAAGLVAAAAPQMATPYGRSAAVPMAQPVPVAAPVAMALSNDLLLDTLVNGFLWNEADTKYRMSLAKKAADLAKYQMKSTTWNQSLTDNLRALAADVTRLIKEEGVQPGPTSLRDTAPADTETVVKMIASRLSDPAFRAVVADRIVRSARAPGDQRFLPGTINQLAAALLSEVQKVAFGGRKTRRGRKVRRTTRRR